MKITGGAVAGYTTSYGYDSYLYPTITTYPDNEIMTTYYNSMGLPAKLTSNTGGDLVDGAQVIGTVGTGGLSDAVSYDEAGRLTTMHITAGGNLWRSQYYHGWTAINSSYPGCGNGRLDEIRVGSSAGSSSLLLLVHDYDSFGNLKRLAENGSNYPFTYDDQNCVTEAYNPNSGGNDYAYDSLGRITQKGWGKPTTRLSPPLPARIAALISPPVQRLH